MRKLTPTQSELLSEVKKHVSTDKPAKYDTLKALCKCKSFDSTFNALIDKGHVIRHETNDYSNQFKLK